ncbi:MAG TPA: SpoIIE family protein phosphatase [Thermoanaerobaculia bacterium]
MPATPAIARLVAIVALAVLVILAAAGLPYVTTLARLALAAASVLVLFWLAIRSFRAFLWKVSRRLAFSYFLIGVLPIFMALLLLVVGAYFLAGFFMGHLYRDATRTFALEIESLAAERARSFAVTGKPVAGESAGLAVGYYRDGRRVAGDPRAPAAWPAHLAELCAMPRSGRRENMVPYVPDFHGGVTLAGAAARRGVGAVVLYTGTLEEALSEASGVWVELVRPDEPEAGQVTRLQWHNLNLPLQRIHRERAVGAAETFFKRRSEGQRLWDEPFLYWGERASQLRRLDGAAPAVATRAAAAGAAPTPAATPAEAPLDVTLRSTPRILVRHLFSSSAEVDSAAWGALIALAFLLFDLYLAATVMALFMIVGLSRAVNRMSRATAAVQAGDFSARIPVRRRDQVGALHRSFNQMAGNLETLVAAAGQKEAIDKELAIARDLQQSLIPTDLPAGGGVEFATLFEPSAAIGGDYFDVLDRGPGRLAVFIADVSGHGLSTGLRMAMIKSALSILIEDGASPEAILRRLDRLVRADVETRSFVTATLALVDLAAGTLEIWNAGHPPTYLLRRGEVQEILLPSSALGGLGAFYDRRALALEPGDVVVWLSDGLIEAPAPDGQPFGYEATLAALQGPCDSAAAVRDRLLQAIARHAGDRPPEDDRTLVVMEWRGVERGGAEVTAQTSETTLAASVR